MPSRDACSMPTCGRGRSSWADPGTERWAFHNLSLVDGGDENISDLSCRPTRALIGADLLWHTRTVEAHDGARIYPIGVSGRGIIDPGEANLAMTTVVVQQCHHRVEHEVATGVD